MRTRLAFIVIAFSPLVAAAQDSTAEITFESTVLEVGETVDGQLVLTNTGEPDAPSLVAPPGLELLLTSPRPSQNSQMSIINGRRSQRVSYIYSLRLTAKKEGVHTIGPLTVSAGGAAYRTNAVTINVRPASTAARALGDQYIFAKIDVSPTSLYVTQSFTATLTIGIRKLEIDGRLTDVGSLLQFIDGRSSELSIFGTNFSSSEMSLNDSSGVKHPYLIYKNSKEMRGEQVGALSVGPVFLKMNYPTRLRRGFFGDVEASQSRKEIARADAIPVVVKGPPDQGRPADYTGAIGTFQFRTQATPQRVELGRPFTLSLLIRGAPLDGLAAPDLSRYSELASRFDFAVDELTGDKEGDAKVFRRAIFPKQQGEQTIPALTWSYFDPAAEKYVTLTSDPIPVIVDPPPAGSESTLAEVPGAADNGKNGLTVLTGGIAPNYVDPQDVLVNHAFSPASLFVVAWFVLPPVVWLGITLVTLHLRRLQLDSGFARARSARTAASKRIRAALNQPDTAQQWAELAHAVTGFVCDRLNLPPGERTPEEVRVILQEHGLDESRTREIVDFLERCSAVRYAPGSVGSSSPADMTSTLQQWLGVIERSVQ